MSEKKARTTKKLTTPSKELKKALSVVRGQLTKSETKLTKATGKAERWKKEATAQRRAASRSGARVEKLQKKLDRAAAAVEPLRATGADGGRCLGGAGGRTHVGRRGHRPGRDVERRPAPGRGTRAWTGRDVQQTEGAAARRAVLSGGGVDEESAGSLDGSAGRRVLLDLPPLPLMPTWKTCSSAD